MVLLLHLSETLAKGNFPNLLCYSLSEDRNEKETAPLKYERMAAAQPKRQASEGFSKTLFVLSPPSNAEKESPAVQNSRRLVGFLFLATKLVKSRGGKKVSGESEREQGGVGEDFYFPLHLIA